MSTGILRIQTYTSRQASALPGVTVTVTGDGFTQNFVTDQEGNAPDLEIQAPDPALSLDPTNTTRQPYSLVNITGTARGIMETGCKFPLDNGEIRCDYQYGTSNEVLPGQTAVVSVKEGLLLLIKDFPEV